MGGVRHSAWSDLSHFSSPPLREAFSGFCCLLAPPRRHFPGSWQLSLSGSRKGGAAFGVHLMPGS